MEMNFQYMFGQLRKPLLMGTINISLGVLMHRLSPCSLSVGLLEARRVWRRMIITMTGVHPIVTKGSVL